MSDVCELCGSSNELSEFSVSGRDDASVVLCSVCKSQIESGELDENHFNCLNDSMWSESSAVKVLTFRLLSQLSRQDLLDMIYLEDDEREWAESGLESGEKVIYKDANGVVLNAGDSGTITKDLDVKGAGFTAKRGTTVRNISLPTDDETHIEGRVNGVKIMIKTEFLKKA